jgi:tellurite resistance protein
MENVPASMRELADAKLEALIEMMFLAVHADGEFGEEERGELAANVHALSGGKIAGPKFRELATRIEKQITQGRAERIAHVKTFFTTDQERQDALAVVIRLVAADGIVRTSERELILEIAEGLDIELDVAADLVRDLTRSAK